MCQSVGPRSVQSAHVPGGGCHEVPSQASWLAQAHARETTDRDVDPSACIAFSRRRRPRFAPVQQYRDWPPSDGRPRDRLSASLPVRSPLASHSESGSGWHGSSHGARGRSSA
eukprot:2098151-Rhodomonas_salina.5